jgi:hypothetical protein
MFCLPSSRICLEGVSVSPFPATATVLRIRNDFIPDRDDFQFDLDIKGRVCNFLKLLRALFLGWQTNKVISNLVKLLINFFPIRSGSGEVKNLDPV